MVDMHMQCKCSSNWWPSAKGKPNLFQTFPWVSGVWGSCRLVLQVHTEVKTTLRQLCFLQDVCDKFPHPILWFLFFRWCGAARHHTGNHLVASVLSTPISAISFSSFTLALELGALFLSVLCIILCLTSLWSLSRVSRAKSGKCCSAESRQWLQHNGMPVAGGWYIGTVCSKTQRLLLSVGWSWFPKGKIYAVFTLLLFYSSRHFWG